jgi:hypothetical protein
MLDTGSSEIIYISTNMHRLRMTRGINTRMNRNLVIRILKEYVRCYKTTNSIAPYTVCSKLDTTMRGWGSERFQP